MLYSIQGQKPTLPENGNYYIAPSAEIIGDVTIGEGSSVWFQCVLRGDHYPIRIGKNTNIQDHSVLHITGGKNPTILGDNVTLGHRVLVHGAELKDYAFAGMGSIIMDRAIIHSFGLVAAGALIPPGFEVPEYTLAAGVPAKIIRELKESEIEMIRYTAKLYAENAVLYRNTLKPLAE
ncbi:MAG: gamma carbonic anhydrase family protein [Candidatus Hydrogenedentota bacterium]|nr:MAG: gamma carbonic anhydrase family protein [Candidatus Hydrogenedentota bacterium]